MSTLTNIVIVIVACIHVYILILEMFLWDKPYGLKAFGQSQAAATASKVLAANQGLYNGFLAAGLFRGLYLGIEGKDTVVFFLSCIVIAGIYGTATVNRRVFFVQVIPAAIGLLLIAFV